MDIFFIWDPKKPGGWSRFSWFISSQCNFHIQFETFQSLQSRPGYMYKKNRNNRIFFKFPFFDVIEWWHPEWEKSNHNHILFKNFPLGFLLNLLVRNIKRGGFQKKIQRSLSHFYINTLVSNGLKKINTYLMSVSIF